MNAEQMFHKYRNLIRKLAWYFAKRWGVEFEELEAQGYLLFVEALGKFDPSKAAFSTYLYNRLRMLGDYCDVKLRKSVTLPSDQDPDEGLAADPKTVAMQTIAEKAYEAFVESLEYAQAIIGLSADASRILSWITEGEWRSEGYLRTTPSLNLCVEFWKPKGWALARVESAWRELGEWWRNQIGTTNAGRIGQLA